MTSFGRGIFKMKYGMLPQDNEKYENEVRTYVNGVLTASLSTGIDLDPAKEHEHLMLLQKLLANPELREQIVEKIVNYGIRYSMLSYKPNLNSEVRETVFMKQIYSFLTTYQISLLAVQFDKQIEAEKAQEHSR